jgi:hypothetical protein
MPDQKQGPREQELVTCQGLAYVHDRILVVPLLLAFLSGCATSWQPQGSFYRTTQTQLRVESNPQGKVYVNNKYVGLTPLETPLEYGQEVERKTRKVSYWDTQPGWSLFVTLLSLGLYLPFSLIPVDVDTSLEPRESYKDNVFAIEIDTEGYKKWRQEVIGKGEKTVALQPVLEEEAGQ